MNVIAYDKYPVPNSDINYVSLEELFTKSDVISLHCPLTKETEHIIDEKAVSLMKKGVHILNTSRGALIDSNALLKGIKERKIGAACLDVYEEESEMFFEDKSGHIMDDDNLLSLLAMPNVIVTSHQAFLTNEALANIADITVGNIVKFFNNEDNFDNEVCYHCGNEATCSKKREGKCF
jgi:D-lactate dehydrogenase